MMKGRVVGLWATRRRWLSSSSSLLEEEDAALALEERRDVVVSVFGAAWRGKCAAAERTVREAGRRHGVAEARLPLLSQAVCAALLACDAKGEERVAVTLRRGARVAFAEALPALGEVRAYLREEEGEGEEGAKEEEETAHLAFVAYGARAPSVSVVRGGAEALLRAQGLAARFFPFGAAVLAQSAAAPPSLEAQEQLRARLDALAPMQSASELARRLAPSEEERRQLRLARVWTAFHCRCALPANARAFAAPGETLVCHFCAKHHLVL